MSGRSRHDEAVGCRGQRPAESCPFEACVQPQVTSTAESDWGHHLGSVLSFQHLASRFSWVWTKLSLSPDTGDVPGCAVRERGGHSDAPHSPVHARTCSDLVIPTPQVRPQAHAQMLPKGMIFVPGLSEARPYHRLLCKLLVELEPLMFMFTRTLCGPVWISVAAWDFSISTAILSPSALARSSRVLSRLMSCLGVHEHPGSLTGQGRGGGGPLEPQSVLVHVADAAIPSATSWTLPWTLPHSLI